MLVGRSRRAVWVLVSVAAFFVLAVAARPDSGLPGGTFIDDDGNVHEGYIESIAAAGITRGCNPPDNTRYCPAGPVTRGQMAAFLVRALGMEPASTDAFGDDDESIFEREIDTLAAAGITRGCDPPANRSFCPDDRITRGQMAAFLARAFGYGDPGAGDRFVDDDGSVFEGDIDRLATAGITKGCNPSRNDRFCPDDDVRRDEMASFLGRATNSTPVVPPPRGDTMVIDEDTMITDQRLVMRPGDAIEFRNGARLMIGEGASVDWQGTPTETWSDDGKVQNLERDVEISGRGDIMFMEGSRASTIRFVEIDLQPRPETNHYPLHWHFAGDGSRGTLVEGVVVENSTNRAFVPHASHGITFRDTIARNIAGEAYWWNSPPDDDKGSRVNNSNDIVFDRILADGITNLPGDDRGFTLGAIQLGAGEGNAIRDSVARNVHPTHRDNCSGFKWPSHSIHQPGAWEAENLKAFGSDCHGIRVWQNTEQAHVVDGFVSTEGISQGAYISDFEYRDIHVPYIVAHAVYWDVYGGSIGEVRGVPNKSNNGGDIEFEDVAVDRLVVDNDGGAAVEYIFRDTGLSCANVEWESWSDGTAVVIDDTACPIPP